MKRNSIFWLLAWMLSGPAYCAPLKVYFLAGIHSHIPAETFAAVRKAIESGTGAKVFDHPFAGNFQENSLIVAFGVDGAKAAEKLDPSIPVLDIFIPARSYLAVGQTREGISAIYIDQPIERQLRFIRLALPQSSRVGVLLGPDSRSLLPGIRQSAEHAKLEIVPEELSDPANLFVRLRSLLSRCDVLLAVPDPLVYNGESISGILLTAYRHGIPLVGFSASYEKAGALLALYSTAEQIGTQAVEFILDYVRTGKMPPPAYPVYFTVGVNRYVARSMGMDMPDESMLEEKMSREVP
ncbi:MAG: hypothetical protein HKL98_01375 [Burkholderiales bacterium]|nr:hypothetical protein [Burkholderiales bacterium]